MRKVDHQGDHIVGLEHFESLRREHGLGHAAGGHGGDGITTNIVFFSFFGAGHGESVDAQLRGGVVGLSEGSVESRAGRSVHDPAEALLLHDGPGRAGGLEGAFEVHLHDQVPVEVRHFAETHIAENAGVVDQHVHTAESLHRGINDFVSELDGVVIGDGLAAEFSDFFDDFVGVFCSGCVSFHVTAQIVDDHLKLKK